jgi:hypothetical protein
MQGKECTCASIELAKRRVSSRMITTDKINHGLKIRRGKSLGLFTRSSLIGTLMRAGFFITVIPICASAQTREQITATQEQIAAQQAQKNADLAISQRDPLQAQLDAISQRDALQAQLEDTTLAASRRDAAPSTAPATQDLTFPPAAPSPSPSPAETPVEMTPVPERGDDATPRAAVLGQNGGAATPDKVQEGAVRAPQDEPSAASTPAATRPRAQGRHGYRPQPPARPKPQLTFWQRLFGHKEPKKAEPRKPRP